MGAGLSTWPTSHWPRSVFRVNIRQPVLQEFQQLTPDDVSPFAAPGAFGPFRVMHQLGVGVLGPVFRTYDPSEDRLVAVKVFHLDMTPEQARTLVEALEHLVGVGLSHPGLVSPIAAGLEDCVPYLAHEYVAAESLDVAMRHYSPAQGETAMLFIRQIADAIDAAHESGIVHGALHLRDVFVTPDEAHVTGFGVVTALEEIGLAGPIRRPYTAPEVITRRAWGGAADRFSLASIAYELMTGRRAAGTGDQVTERLRSVAAAADEEQLQDVFAMALADDPDERYSSAARFVSALGAAIGDETPDSEPGRDEPVTDELEPLDLLAGLELHPADSAVDDALDALNAIEHRVDSPGLGDDSAETTERFSLDATAVPGSEPTVAEDVAQREPVVTDASYEETRDIETAASDDPDTDHLGYGADADGTDDEYLSDDGGDKPSEDDEEAGVELLGRDELREQPEVGVGDEGPQEFIASSGNEEREEEGDNEAAAADEDEALAGDLGHLYDDAVAVPPLPLHSAPQAHRPWWRTTGGLIALALVVGGLVFFVGVGLFPTDAPTDFVLGTDGEAPQETASREFSEVVVDGGSTPPAFDVAGGAPSTPSGSVSEDASKPPPPPSSSSRPAPSSPLTPDASSASPEPPVAVSAPSEEFGWILVRTEPPGATVLLDGVRQGQTPLSLRDVSFGRHQVEVSRPGFVTVQREVAVDASAAVLPLGIELVPADPDGTTGRVAAESGSLAVQSRPAGARVVIDGSLAGRTPIEVDVSVGSHEIRIEDEGYQVWVTTVEVAVDDHLAINASLERVQR